jgi:mannose-6-phosphate isomerase-like protein (cupin superfamily)
VKRIVLPSKEIEHFGSTGFTHFRVAHGDAHVSFARLDGVIGGHETPSQQRLVVLAGRVTCSTKDDSVELGVGEAVEWQEGEWHETRSHEPSVLLLVEGAFE